jgi:response regulator RpfG family c-di-GMP phosphodiesterase
MLGHIERAALLHDIGKLAVPPAIVRKPEPLTVKEHDLLRGHVSVAFVALMVTPFLAPAGEIVLATRERFDGKGYPRGLSKTDIPLGARIIAVSEVFDTLICTRPPFDPRAVRAANAQLARAAGSHFDPQVVRAWLRCGDNLGELGDRRMQC